MEARHRPLPGPYRSRSSSHLGLKEIPDLPRIPAYMLSPGQPSPGQPSLLRHPIAAIRGAGMLTSFPSTTPFGLALGADLPCADERCAGTLGLSARRIFTSFIVTHVSILASDTSSKPRGFPSSAYRTLLYQSCLAARLRSFGAWFQPRYIFRAGRLDQ